MNCSQCGEESFGHPICSACNLKKDLRSRNRRTCSQRARLARFIDTGAASPVAFRLLCGMHDGALHVGAIEVLEPHRYLLRHISPGNYYKPTHDPKLCTNCGAAPCLDSCAFHDPLKAKDTSTVIAGFFERRYP